MRILSRASLLAPVAALLFASCSLFGTGPTTEGPTTEGPTAEGCPGAHYPDWETSPYVLPYPVGGAYPVHLSHCSGSYHSAGQPDAFAIDFAMNVGTLITASRAGRVVHLREDGMDGPGSPNNLVVVDHGDGTYAEYMHLTFEGALVEVGQEVEAGDEIGRSGATGLAGYPHLHFVVVEGRWQYPYTSIPTTFRNAASNVRSLASGYTYRALPY